MNFSEATNIMACKPVMNVIVEMMTLLLFQLSQQNVIRHVVVIQQKLVVVHGD